MKLPSGSVWTCALLTLLVAQPASSQTTAISSSVAVATPDINGNGRYVVWEGAGIQLLDRHTGVAERVDIRWNGGPGNSQSTCPSVSDDGRFVAFTSFASDLVPSDTNGQTDAFVRDRLMSQTTRVSIATNGTEGNLQVSCPITISANGRWVAFASSSNTLVAGDPNGTGWDIFVRDRTLNQTVVASVSSTGEWVTDGDGGTFPKLSANGRVVTFMSTRSSVLAGGPNGVNHIIVRDLDAGLTTLEDRASNGTIANEVSLFPVLSADGRYVAFESGATNLVPNDLSGFIDVFVRDRQTGQTSRVSVSSTGVEGNGHSPGPFINNYISISEDGRFVAFPSAANNLVPSDTNGGVDIFVHDRQTVRTIRASVRDDETEGTCVPGELNRYPVLSGSGLDLVFLSVVSLGTDPPGCAQQTLYVRRVRPAADGDFDVDTRADLTVFRPGNGHWYTLFRTTGALADWLWGVSTDVPVAADYDGDGRADYAIFRPATGDWYALHSWTNMTTYSARQWGLSGDVPVPADYDRDGKADFAVFRPSSGFWHILQSSGGAHSMPFGVSTDLPVPADYDGDRKADLAVYRPSTGVWYVLLSSTGGLFVRQFGLSTDKPVAGDYDRDGRADLAVYRPSTGVWYVLLSSTSFASFAAVQFGADTDVPVPGDFDGDGGIDQAVFRPALGYWFVLNQLALHFGLATDIPVLRR